MRKEEFGIGRWKKYMGVMRERREVNAHRG